MNRPYTRADMVSLPIPETTLRELLWRVGHALCTFTDEAARSLILFAEATTKEQHEKQAAIAEAVTDVRNVHIHLTRSQAEDLAAALIECAKSATDDEPRPTFRMCGLCKHLRPDTRWGVNGTRCLTCYEREMEIHRDYA